MRLIWNGRGDCRWHLYAPFGKLRAGSCKGCKDGAPSVGMVGARLNRTLHHPSSMMIEIGQVEAIFRYPVKSMGGERLDVANQGWHGIDGDRRLAFRRMEDRSRFPWLSAGKLPDLVRFAPLRREDSAPGDLPTHVRTPDGEEMPLSSERTWPRRSGADTGLRSR
jgi:hypothetical protein